MIGTPSSQHLAWIGQQMRPLIGTTNQCAYPCMPLKPSWVTQQIGDGGRLGAEIHMQRLATDVMRQPVNQQTTSARGVRP